MAKHRGINVWGEAVMVLSALGIHLWYLFHTTFVDWPEMLLFPWFLTKNLVYYRDVAIAYAPGANYLLHTLYLLLGYSVASEKVIAYVFILLTDIMVYFCAKTLVRSRVAGGLALFFFVLWQPIYSGNTLWYETMLAPLYLAVYMLTLKYMEKPRLSTILGVGLMLAVATLVKQTAVWAVVAVCLFVWICAAKKKAGFIHAVWIGSVVVAANLLVWAYFAALGAGSQYGFWVFQSLVTFSRSSSLYALAPSRSEIALIIPSLIPFVVLVLFRQTKQVWLLIALTVVLFFSGLPRWALHRLQPMLVGLSISFGLMYPLIVSRKRLTVLVGYAAILLVLAGSWRSYRVFTTLRDPMQPQFFDARYRELLSYVQANAPGPIFVLGNYYHLYFGLNERPAVLPWVPLFPVNAQIPGIQKRLVDSLETNQVPYILYIPFHPQSGYYDGYMPEELFLYVRSKYEKIGAAPVPGGELLRRR